MGFVMLAGGVIGLLLGLIRQPSGKPGPGWTVPSGLVGAAAGSAGWNALLGLPATATTGPALYGGLALALLCVLGVQAMRPAHG